MPRPAAFAAALLALVLLSWWVLQAPRAADPAPVRGQPDALASEPVRDPGTVRVGGGGQPPGEREEVRPPDRDESAAPAVREAAETSQAAEERGFPAGFDWKDPAPLPASSSILVQVIAPDGGFAVGAKAELLSAFAGIQLDRNSAAVSPKSRSFRMHRGVAVAETSARAGGDGWAELKVPDADVGDLWLRGSYEGAMPTLLRLAQRPLDGERFRLVLDAGASLRGVVHGVIPEALEESAGGAVTRVSVAVRARRSGEWQVVRWLDLERGGAARHPFVFEGLVPGRYDVQLMARLEGDDGWVVWSKLREPVRVHPGGVHEVDVLVPPEVLRRAKAEIRCAVR